VNRPRRRRVAAEILSDSDKHERLKNAIQFELHLAILGFVGLCCGPLGRRRASVARQDYTRHRDQSSIGIRKNSETLRFRRETAVSRPGIPAIAFSSGRRQDDWPACGRLRCRTTRCRRALPCALDLLWQAAACRTWCSRRPPRPRCRAPVPDRFRFSRRPSLNRTARSSRVKRTNFFALQPTRPYDRVGVSMFEWRRRESCSRTCTVVHYR